MTSDQSAEKARVMIRYSFAGNANRNMSVTIDNGTYDVVFKPTASWDVWDTVYIDDVWVDALDFKVTFQSATADGGPNIDMFAFDMANVYRTGCKAVREKQHGPVSIASKKITAKPRSNGITVNALGQKVQNVRNQSDLRNLPKGNYFRY